VNSTEELERLQLQLCSQLSLI